MSRQRVPYQSDTVNSVMAACNKASNWRTSLGLLSEMPQRQLQRLFMQFWIIRNAAITACANAGEWQPALALLNAAGPRDTVSYNAAITACEEGDEWRVGLDLLGTMLSKVVHPDVERLLSLLAAFHQQVVAEQQQAEHLSCLAHRRAEGRFGEIEEQQRRTEARLLELSRGLMLGTRRSLGDECQTLNGRCGILAKAQEEVEREIGRQLSFRNMNSFNHYRLPLNSLATWIPAGYMLIVDVLVIQPCPRRQLQEDLNPRVESLESQSKCREVRSDTNDSFCSLANEGARCEEEARELPEAFTQALKRLEHHVLDELSKVHERCDALQMAPVKLAAASCHPSPEDGAEELARKIESCEERCEDLRKRFAERSAELAVHVQAGFAEAKGHMDVVVSQLGQISGGREADDKAQLAKRVERIETRLGDQALAAGNFKSGLEMVRQTIEKLKTTIVPAVQGTSKVEQIRGDVRAVEEELAQLKSRTEHLESCAARRPPPVEILRAAALTDLAPKPEEGMGLWGFNGSTAKALKPCLAVVLVRGVVFPGMLTFHSINAEEMAQSEENGPGLSEAPHAAFTTLQIALDSFEEVLLQADATYSAKAAQWEAALALFASMSSRQLEVSCVTFGAAATAMEEASLWLEAIDLLVLMDDASLPADRVVCSAAISACARGGIWKEAAASVALSRVDDARFGDAALLGSN
eukprot:s12_g8.t1